MEACLKFGHNNSPGYLGVTMGVVYSTNPRVRYLGMEFHTSVAIRSSQLLEVRRWLSISLIGHRELGFLEGFGCRGAGCCDGAR